MLAEDWNENEHDPQCPHCKGTGMTGYVKPLADLEGEIHMVFIPQICSCSAGIKKYDEMQKGEIWLTTV